MRLQICATLKIKRKKKQIGTLIKLTISLIKGNQPA